MKLVVLAVALIFAPHKIPLVASIGFGLLAYSVASSIIVPVGEALKSVGLKGTDISKKHRPVIPESCGAVVGLVLLFSLILFIPSLFYKYLVATPGGGVRIGALEEIATEKGYFAHSKLSEYLSGVLSLQSMLILGFVDDLFDLRWRHKFFLPAIASIPMLLVYYIDFGVTQVAVPTALQSFFGESLDLGALYYLYMGAFSIFFTNCINIYAGVNGIEVGQSVVLGSFVLLNDLLYILCLDKDHPAVESHSFSAYVLLPFLGASIALLRANWFPAKVFVGDTYCYLAGMVFAVIGILGHFTKTLLSLSGPQIFNFVYSLPQLFHIVPCPRHRMPKFNPETGLLEVSRADVSKCKPIVIKVLRVLAFFGLIAIYETEKTLEISNMTIINLVLVHVGPMREDKLTTLLMGIQAAWAALALCGRHLLARAVFGDDNF